MHWADSKFNRDLVLLHLTPITHPRNSNDELKVFVSSRVLGGHSAPTLAGGLGATSLEDSIGLRLERTERIGDGILLEYSVVR